MLLSILAPTPGYPEVNRREHREERGEQQAEGCGGTEIAATIRRPHMVPRAYTARTLFRVGDRWGVTAAELVRMAEESRPRNAA